MGVDPTCTRNPPCPLHQQSLSDVIGGGKPVAVMFATPALCESRYCGPVLDDLLTLVGQFQDRITFVHVEIYQGGKPNQNLDVVPTVKEWGLTSEPWLFVVGADGRVVDKFEGSIALDEVERSLAAFRRAIDDGDEAQLERLLEAGKQRRVAATKKR